MHDTPVYQVLGGDSGCHKDVTVLSSGDGTEGPSDRGRRGAGLILFLLGIF